MFRKKLEKTIICLLAMLALLPPAVRRKTVKVALFIGAGFALNLIRDEAVATLLLLVLATLGFAKVMTKERG